MKISRSVVYMFRASLSGAKPEGYLELESKEIIVMSKKSSNRFAGILEDLSGDDGINPVRIYLWFKMLLNPLMLPNRIYPPL